jgi:hypothetical protein
MPSTRVFQTSVDSVSKLEMSGSEECDTLEKLDDTELIIMLNRKSNRNTNSVENIILADNGMEFNNIAMLIRSSDSIPSKKY